MTSLRFKVLFHLSNGDIDIVEIRRLDLLKQNDKSQLFYWLLIKKAKKDRSPERLTFLNMSSEGENQVRIFEQGSLTYDSHIGQFSKIHEETPHLLRVHPSPELNSQLAETIEKYLP